MHSPELIREDCQRPEADYLSNEDVSYLSDFEPDINELHEGIRCHLPKNNCQHQNSNIDYSKATKGTMKSTQVNHSFHGKLIGNTTGSIKRLKYSQKSSSLSKRFPLAPNSSLLVSTQSQRRFLGNSTTVPNALEKWESCQRSLADANSRNTLLQRQLDETRKELKTVERMCKMQSSRLNKAIGQEADFPQLVDRLTSEVRSLQTRLRDKSAQLDTNQRRCSEWQHRILVLEKELEEVHATQNSELHPLKKEARRFEELMSELHTEKKLSVSLQHQLELTSRSHKHQVAVLYDQIRQLKLANSHLERQLANHSQLLQEKVKLLELQNIYSKRIPRSVPIPQAVPALSDTESGFLDATSGHRREADHHVTTSGSQHLKKTDMTSVNMIARKSKLATAPRSGQQQHPQRQRKQSVQKNETVGHFKMGEDSEEIRGEYHEFHRRCDTEKLHGSELASCSIIDQVPHIDNDLNAYTIENRNKSTCGPNSKPNPHSEQNDRSPSYENVFSCLNKGHHVTGDELDENQEVTTTCGPSQLSEGTSDLSKRESKSYYCPTNEISSCLEANLVRRENEQVELMATEQTNVQDLTITRQEPFPRTSVRLSSLTLITGSLTDSSSQERERKNRLIQKLNELDRKKETKQSKSDDTHYGDRGPMESEVPDSAKDSVAATSDNISTSLFLNTRENELWNEIFGSKHEVGVTSKYTAKGETKNATILVIDANKHNKTTREHPTESAVDSSKECDIQPGLRLFVNESDTAWKISPSMRPETTREAALIRVVKHGTDGTSDSDIEELQL